MGEISERFKIPKSSVQTILEHYRKTGSLDPLAHGGGRSMAYSGAVLDALEKDLDEHPDATLAQLREMSGMRVSLVAVHNAVKKLGFTRKKKRYVRENNAEKT